MERNIENTKINFVQPKHITPLNTTTSPFMCFRFAWHSAIERGEFEMTKTNDTGMYAVRWQKLKLILLIYESIDHSGIQSCDHGRNQGTSS